MSSKALIYAVNTTKGTALADGDIYSPNKIVRRFGKYANISNDGIQIGNLSDCKGSTGYYEVCAGISVVAQEAGDIVATILANGVQIPGAYAIATVANGDSVTLTIPASTTRITCGKQLQDITVMLSGVASQSINLSMQVEKV